MTDPELPDAGPRPVAASLDHVTRALGMPSAAVLEAVFSQWPDLVGPTAAANAPLFAARRRAGGDRGRSGVGQRAPLPGAGHLGQHRGQCGARLADPDGGACPIAKYPGKGLLGGKLRPSQLGALTVPAALQMPSIRQC